MGLCLQKDAYGASFLPYPDRKNKGRGPFLERRPKSMFWLSAPDLIQGRRSSAKEER
jgi:hypothetical protein